MRFQNVKPYTVYGPNDSLPIFEIFLLSLNTRRFRSPPCYPLFVSAANRWKSGFELKKGLTVKTRVYQVFITKWGIIPEKSFSLHQPVLAIFRPTISSHLRALFLPLFTPRSCFLIADPSHCSPLLSCNGQYLSQAPVSLSECRENLKTFGARQL